MGCMLGNNIKSLVSNMIQTMKLLPVFGAILAYAIPAKGQVCYGQLFNTQGPSPDFNVPKPCSGPPPCIEVYVTIGCVITIMCLAITLVIYASCSIKNSRCSNTGSVRSKQQQDILINQFVALLCLLITFVIGVDRRYPTGGCIAAGFFIHFFLLATMAWMSVEALNTYQMSAKISTSNLSHFMVKACIFAWGVPSVICIVIVAVDRNLYLGNVCRCFLNPGSALYFGLLLPIAIGLFFNTIMYLLVLRQLMRKRPAAPDDANPAYRNETKRRLQNAVGLTILLGLTGMWVSLAIIEPGFIFDIIFLIFAILLGIFIFIAYCIWVSEVYEQWLMCHCSQCKTASEQISL